MAGTRLHVAKPLQWLDCFLTSDEPVPLVCGKRLVETVNVVPCRMCHMEFDRFVVEKGVRKV
jgi:hypothetical protein